MTAVVIQPSGSADARRNWAITMDAPFPFTRIDNTLSPQQRDMLHQRHPEQASRLWGMTSNHDNLVDTLQRGDVVLFTGQKHVKGIGEIGVVIRNSQLGDALWKAHPDRGSYSNVYSLKAFQDVQIPYEEIWDLPSFNPGDTFRGARRLTGVKAEEILNGLDITTATAQDAEARQEVADATNTVRELGDEAINVERTVVNRPSATLTVNRAEAVLVRSYRESLGSVRTRRTRTIAGITDLVLDVDSGGIEVIEAKSQSTPQAVRTAIGQIIHYASYHNSVTRMTILLPRAPDDDLTQLANALGIDIVFKDSEIFTRKESTEFARTAVVNLLKSD